MKIILYTTHCPKCRVVETKLSQKGIKYESCEDVEIMRQKGISTLPVLEINGVFYNFKDAVNYINNI